MRLLRDLLLVLLVGAGAVGGSQLPSFVQAYEQRLGGARQEARRQLERFRDLARSQGVDLDLYIDRLGTNPDPLVVRTSRAVSDLRGRAGDLEAQARELAAASRLTRPVVVLTNGDRELLEGTWRAFQPTLALDPAFGALGGAVGWLVRIALGAIAGLAWATMAARKPG